MIVDMQISLETQNLRITDIRAVDERAQEQECKDRQYPTEYQHRIVSRQKTNIPDIHLPQHLLHQRRIHIPHALLHRTRLTMLKLLISHLISLHTISS